MKNKIVVAALILSLMAGALAGCKVDEILAPDETEGSATQADGGDQDSGGWVIPDAHSQDPVEIFETTGNNTEPDDPDADDQDTHNYDPNDTDDSDEINESDVVTTPTPKAIGKAKVTNAYKKTFKTKFLGKVTSKIPQVMIEGYDTKKINKEILGKLKSKAKKNKVTYTYHIGKKYVSIFIEVYYDLDWEETEHYIYNISRENGKKLNRSGMLKAVGVSSSKFNSRTKKAVQKYWKECQFTSNKAMYNKAISKKSLNSAIPYVNSKGKLCYLIKDMEIPAGGGIYDNYGTC